MTRRLIAAALALTTLSACRSDTLPLIYRFDPGSKIAYRMQADGRARWDIAGEGSGSYSVTFEVTERVVSSDESGAVVSVAMIPTQVEQDNLPSPGSGERSFTLKLGPHGEVLEVLSIDGLPASEANLDECSFIGTFRPPLPLEPVRLGEDWESEQQLELGGLFRQQVVTVGELHGLDRDSEGKVARLTHRGQGPLACATDLPQGQADLTGAATTTTQAELDIDGGFLREATSKTEADLDVRVNPVDQEAPIVGTLHLEQQLELDRI